MTSKRYENHEKNMLKSILSRSLSSDAPSEETINKANSYSGVNSEDPYKKLKYTLLEKYQGNDINDIDGSEIVENKYGETLQIKNKEKIDFNLKNENFKKDLLCDLKLVPNIGQATEKKLKKEGFKDIHSLLDHHRFSKHAETAIQKLESGHFNDTFNLVRKNSYSSNNLIKCVSELDNENFKFMDIETLGLSNVPIILIGIAELNKNGKSIESTQYLLREKSEEAAVLESFISHLDEDSIYVTYNGAKFDVPFIQNRCSYYKIDYNHKLINYDLLYFARRLWKSKLPNCKLTTIERYLFDIERIDDVPGQHIPEYYETYLKENNIGPLIPIIEHNRMDIVSLAKFLIKMYYEN